MRKVVFLLQDKNLIYFQSHPNKTCEKNIKNRAVLGLPLLKL